MDTYKPFGKLEIVETYTYYDGVLLFSCESESGKLYLAVLVDRDKDTDVWLYVEVSHKRFVNLRADKIDLHDVFSKAESGVVYRVGVGLVELSVKKVPCAEIDDEWLSERGECLNLLGKSCHVVTGGNHE